jgi:L-ascorbate metabolism protein UlaG (beta-lactamase superfamily)
MPTTLERVVHACVLLDFDGAKILTDPWFSERVLYHQGEPRSVATPADLPRLDGIVISHAHYDHCDLGALASYPDKNVPIVVNRGTGKKVRAKGWRNGLSSRPQRNRQEVMDAAQAAELTGLLHPRLAVPIHYAYTAGAVGDRILVKLDRNHPEHYRDAAGDLAPGTEVHILPTGQVLKL